MAHPSDDMLQRDLRASELSPWRAALRQWPQVLVVVGVFAVLGYAVSAVRPERYRATGNVFLFAQQQEGQADSLRRVRTEAEVITSRDVANLVSQRLRTMTPAEVQAAVEATPSETTDIVALSAEADSADESVRLLSAVESAYEAVRRERAQTVYRKALAQLERDRGDLEAELFAVERTLASNPVDAEAARQRDRLSQELANIQTQASQLSLNRLNAGTGVFYDPPDPPTEPISPQPLRNAAIGALLGAFLATLFFWWRAHRSRFAEDPSVATARLGIPLLADVPPKRPERAAGAEARPRDTYHWILAIVDRALEEGSSKLVVVTSADDARASASVILKLAAAVAEDGRQVLLVDADARTASLSSVLDAGDAPGFSDVAGRTHPAADVGLPRTIDGARIRFVPVGTRCRDTGAIYPSRDAIDVVSALDGAPGDVYLHLPPLASCPETSILAQKAGGVIVVVTPRTLLASLDRLRAVAEAFDLNVLGYVFDRSPQSGVGTAGKRPPPHRQAQGSRERLEPPRARTRPHAS
jgi:Mrp family chromosome partitioning ATPase/uncharacterized protein involved in exopolysaccharide biosynthesis